MAETVKLAREIASLEVLFPFLTKEFEQHSIDDKTAFSINLAAEELFTNMVRHNTGRGDDIEFSIQISDDRIEFDLVDNDVDPFDADSVPVYEVGRPIEEQQPGGVGVHLVKSIVDKLTYEYRDRVMTVSVTKYLER